MIHPNVILNYRCAFRREHGRETTLHHSEMVVIIETVGVLSSVQEQDMAVLADMAEWESLNAMPSALSAQAVDAILLPA